MSDLSYLKNLDISSHPKATYTVAGYGYQPIIRLSAAPYEPDVSNDYNVPVHELTEEESAKAELWNLLADFNGAYQNFCEAYAQAVIKDAKAQGYDPTGGYTAQAEAMMAADAKNDRTKRFLTFIEPFDDSLKVYAYRAFCQMIDDAGELKGVDFSSVSFSDEFTLGSDIVNPIASQIKSYKETITMGDVEVQIRCGFFRSDNRLGEMKIKRVTGGPTYSVYLLPNENAAKEAVTQYVAALETLGNKAVKNAYTTVIKELTGLSLSSMNEKAMSEALKRLNNKFSKTVIKGFDVGEVLTVLENCYEQFSECKKLVKLKYSSSMMDTMKSSLEKIVNCDMLNPVDFETTAATKDAAKKLTEIETRLIDALEEYVYTGKISGETLGKINKDPFSWLWSGKCPIEIEVYDDNNNQIGYAGGNIWFTDDILIEKRGEEIRVYSKEPVFVHVIGTDYGMMSFTIEEYADGHPTGRVNYYNVPLKENQTYTVSLASSHLSSVADVIMRDEQGTVVPAFEYISTDMDANVQVATTVSSEDAGILFGDGNYVKGDLVTLTAYANEGYEFVGWFNGDDCVSISNTYAFVASKDISLIGQYEEEQSMDFLTFSDVPSDAWYCGAVEFVCEQKLMNGVGNNLFAPQSNLSRAQLAQILYNKEGKPTVTDNSNFTDVPADQWYTSAVIWANKQGVVGGYGNGLFGPNDDITREQLAVMLWRYAGKPTASGTTLNFKDADKVSSWALDAMRWATENSIINGKGNGILDPKGFATRAEVAQMLKNYLER